MKTLQDLVTFPTSNRPRYMVRRVGNVEAVSTVFNTWISVRDAENQAEEMREMNPDTEFEIVDLQARPLTTRPEGSCQSCGGKGHVADRHIGGRWVQVRGCGACGMSGEV